MARVLRLTLKKKWFDKITSGEKKEEYREIKPYWYTRLISKLNPSIAMKIECCKGLKSNTSASNWNFQNGYYGTRDYDEIQFRNGYSKNAPTITVECKGIKIREGRTEWGAVKGEKYFVIELGKILKGG